jgi:Family of unknown function (DUF6174)
MVRRTLRLQVGRLSGSRTAVRVRLGRRCADLYTKGIESDRDNFSFVGRGNCQRSRGLMSNRSLLVIIALLVGVTKLAHAQGVGFAEQLAAAEAIWKRAPLRSYEYTLHYGAVVVYTECESLTLRTRVVNGVVMRTAGCRTLRSTYSSVPMIFQFLKETLATHPDKIEVTFDKTMGFPVSVFVDPRSDMTGDEFHFEVTDFKVLK